MTKLKRCPFCGGEARLVTRRQEGTSIEPKTLHHVRKMQMYDKRELDTQGGYR